MLREQLYDLLISCCLGKLEWGLAIIVTRVDVCTVFEQELRGLHFPLVHCQMQRSSVLVVLYVHVRIVPQ
jgi:hypothetical protein